MGESQLEFAACVSGQYGYVRPACQISLPVQRARHRIGARSRSRRTTLLKSRIELPQRAASIDLASLVELILRVRRAGLHAIRLLRRFVALRWLDARAGVLDARLVQVCRLGR